jgi:transcriptional regulator with XRE-family HTH domain
MENNISERLNLIIKELGLSVNKFAESIGESQSLLHNYVHGRSPSVDVIEKIINHYPQIDAEWLLTGKGEMLKNKNIGHTIHGDNGSIKGNIKVIEQLEQASVIISQLEQRLKDKETIIELLKKQINILENENNKKAR